MTYKILGFINIALVVIITAPYWLRVLNTKLFHIKQPWFQKLLKVLRPLHKILAFVLLASIGVHGYLALGAFQLHTGTLAAAAFLLTAVMGILFFFLHKGGLLKAHRALVLISIILVAVHLLFPKLLSFIK